MAVQFLAPCTLRAATYIILMYLLWSFHSGKGDPTEDWHCGVLVCPFVHSVHKRQTLFWRIFLLLLLLTVVVKVLIPLRSLVQPIRFFIACGVSSFVSSSSSCFLSPVFRLGVF